MITPVVQPTIIMPNFLDSAYYPAVLFGGSWLVARPLTNLQDDFLGNTARSSDADEESTWFGIDFGVSRDIYGIAMTPHNIQRNGKARLRAAVAPNWSGVTVNGVNAENDTTLSVQTTAAIDVKKGDGFTIAGDTTVYQASADVSIGAATIGVIGVVRVGLSGSGLVEATVGGEVITCHAGDFDNAVLDTTLEDVWQVVYPFGTLPFGHESWTDGKISPEDAVSEKIPYVKFPGLIIARYWRIDISDEANTDGYIDIGRLIIGRTTEISVGMPYGNLLDLFSDSEVKKSKGGVRRVNRQEVGRRFPITLENVPEDEAMVFWNDLKQLGLDKQVFVAFNKNDTVHLHRRSFLATLEKIDVPNNFSRFRRNDLTVYFQEVIA